MCACIEIASQANLLIRAAPPLYTGNPRAQYLAWVMSSRGANYVTQVLLRPKCSDLTGSFRYGKAYAF